MNVRTLPPLLAARFAAVAGIVVSLAFLARTGSAAEVAMGDRASATVDVSATTDSVSTTVDSVSAMPDSASATPDSVNVSADPAGPPTAEERELPPPGVRTWQTGLLRPDRLEHGSLAFTIGLGTGLATKKPAAAFAVPAVLGLGKEVADRGGTGFDWVDLAADLLGAAAAGALTALW